MFTYSLAYRFRGADSGAEFVEGFQASASSSAAARGKAIGLAAAKCGDIGETFAADRLIEGSEGLTPAELATVKSDWKIRG